MWAIWILYNLLAVRFFLVGIYPFSFIIFITDIIFILPNLHLFYIIQYRQITVKRIIYPDISFPCDKINAILNAMVFGFSGAYRSKNYSLGSVEVKYSRKNKLESSVTISPKERDKFLNELTLHTAKEVILLNYAERSNGEPFIETVDRRRE
jgi:hypothetical protein